MNFRDLITKLESIEESDSIAKAASDHFMAGFKGKDDPRMYLDNVPTADQKQNQKQAAKAAPGFDVSGINPQVLRRAIANAASGKPLESDQQAAFQTILKKNYGQMY